MAAGFKVGNWISQGTRLGSGSFATVYAGTHVETGREVAIKVMDLTKLTGQIGPSTPENRAANTAALQRLAAEIKLQMVCNSPYTVPLIEVFTANENLYLVMERCWGDLRKLLLTFGGRFSESTTRRLMRQLAMGYLTLYEQKIVHRDLKPQNLLVCFEPPDCVDPDHAVVKISDFGFAKLLDDKKDEVTGTLCGSPLYMAPEIFRQPPSYNAKADLYSIGAIMMELLTGRAPYPLPAIAAIIEVHRFQTHLPVPIPDSLVQEASPSCLDLLRRLLHKSPITRLSFAEFFEHPWLDLVAFRSALAPSPLAPGVVMPPSPAAVAAAPSPVAAATPPSDSAINCQELIDTLRSIERSLPGLPAEESIFDKPLTADTMAIFAARMADFVDDFRSLSAENQRLRSDQRRKIVGSDFLQPGDGAMFFWADGGYKAYGRSFQHRYVLSPDSFPAFKDEINRKNVVFGTVERLVPRVEASTVEVVLLPWTAKPRSSDPSVY